MSNKEELNNIDYFKNKKVDRTYVSRRLTDKYPDGTTRDIRIVSKVIDSPETWTHAKLRDEIVLRVTPGGRQEIIAKLFEDSRGVFVLSIQRYTAKNGNPHQVNFSFIGKEIAKLKNFIDSLKYLNFSLPFKDRIEDEELEKMRELLMDNENLGLLIEMAQKKITKRDVVALAYRKEQLGLYEQLLHGNTFFEQKKLEWKKTKNEDIWQFYFESNPWIFGYGLNFVFNEPLQGKKLEQVVSGFDVVSAGKKVDGLLKTRGIISSLCLVEVKTHKTDLLKPTGKSYRPDCWQLSDELNGGIVQIQKTLQKSIKSIGTRLSPRLKNGDPTGEDLFLYQPKSYLVIGSLSEFVTDYGINEEKFASFELYRRNITNPEIITFDELFERAKFIVHNNELNIVDATGKIQNQPF